MFCKNCGTQINDNERFCGSCGTPVEQKEQPIINNNISTPVAAPTEVDGSLAITFIVTVVLQLIMLILRFVSFGKYRVAVEDLGISDGGTYSLNELMSSSGETTIFVILILASIILCILPIIKNTLGKRRRMILSKIVAFWNAFTVGMGIWAIADCVASNKESIAYNYGEEFFSGSWSLTFGGWLNVIITVAIIIVLFVISKKTKKYSK